MSLPNIGDLIDGKFRVEQKLGEGGTSTVYAVRHVITDKPFAIKWLSPELAQNEAAVERFIHEARVCGRYAHANAVQIYDVCRTNDSFYLWMELLEGESLHARLERVERLGVQASCDIIVPCTHALAAAHRVGIIHRDLKPSNIFLCVSQDGATVPKVLDFGISKLNRNGFDLSPVTTTTQTVVGTPHYMAPEQMRGRPADPRFDIYALGVVLYELVSGELPFDAENLADLVFKILEAKPARFDRIVAANAGFARVVARAMAFDANARFASMEELAQALQPYCSPPPRVASLSAGLVQVAAAAVPSSPRATAAPSAVGKPHPVPAAGPRDVRAATDACARALHHDLSVTEPGVSGLVVTRPLTSAASSAARTRATRHAGGGPAVASARAQFAQPTAAVPDSDLHTHAAAAADLSVDETGAASAPASAAPPMTAAAAPRSAPVAGAKRALGRRVRMTRALLVAGVGALGVALLLFWRLREPTPTVTAAASEPGLVRPADSEREPAARGSDSTATVVAVPPPSEPATAVESRASARSSGRGEVTRGAAPASASALGATAGARSGVQSEAQTRRSRADARTAPGARVQARTQNESAPRAQSVARGKLQARTKPDSSAAAVSRTEPASRAGAQVRSARQARARKNDTAAVAAKGPKPDTKLDRSDFEGQSQELSPPPAALSRQDF